jgi:hypothetical protein
MTDAEGIAVTEDLNTPSTTPVSGLTFERTVPRGLAHRRAVAEVFVTDTVQAGTDEFLAAIQIPRAHCLWFDRKVSYHDPLSTVEAIRQALTVIGQQYLQLPAATPGSLQSLQFSVEDISAYLDTERSPLEGIVRLRPHISRGDKFFFREASFDANLTVGSALAMSMRCGVVTFPRGDYEELRRLGRTGLAADVPSIYDDIAPVDPAAVGRIDGRNVVVARCHETLVLVVDQRHPSFFDHPYDHVPGPLLLEGCRQAAVLAACGSGAIDSPIVALTGAALNFSGFAELDVPIELAADADEGIFGELEVAIAIRQFDRTIADGRIELSPYPS